MQEKILINTMDFKVKSRKQLSCYTTLKRNENYVLTTKVIGEITGSCYLVLSKSDVKRILKVCLPEAVNSVDKKLEGMAQAILLEIDNIVSASVITQLSNLLHFKMHGGVPDLKEIHGSDFLEFIKKEDIESDSSLSFRVKFMSEGKSFNPEFIWVLNSTFFNGVSRYIENSESLNRLKDTKEQSVKA